jgi:hypothetical protein
MLFLRNAVKQNATIDGHRGDVLGEIAILARPG